jgi:hypothetical protein
MVALPVTKKNTIRARVVLRIRIMRADNWRKKCTCLFPSEDELLYQDDCNTVKRSNC